MALDDVYRCVFNYTVQGQPCTMVNHWVEIAETTQNPQLTAGGIAAEFLSRIDDFFTDELSSDAKVLSFAVNRIWPQLGDMATIIPTSSIEGGIAGDAVPELAAALVTFYTGVASKSGRGRCYIAGIPQSHVDAGVWIESNYSQWESSVQSLFANMTPIIGGLGSFQLAVWSRKLNEATPVNVFQPRTVLGTQRRRKPRIAALASGETP